MYVYLSHSFRDILIAQLPAVRRCHARQLRSTLHHHWPRISLLYHFLVVCCIKLCLVLKYVLNDCRCICHFGWGHSHHVVQAPSPTPSECAHHSCSTKQDSCLNMWVSIAPHVYPVLDSERQWSYSAYCSTGACTRMILSLLECTCASVLLTSTTMRAKFFLIIMRWNQWSL